MATHLLSRMVAVVCILLAICNVVVEASRKSNLSSKKLLVQKYLKRLNKPAVKSIKSPDGDIIDCVLMAHQPAFDHPALKNHTIQMRPNYLPEGAFVANEVHEDGLKPITQSWHLNGRCPEGTIPIRRTKKEDLLRANSIETFGKKKYKTIPQLNSVRPQEVVANNFSHQYVLAYIRGAIYYGAKAAINVWNPKVQSPREFSLSQIWIAGGSEEELNTIEVGWQVYPELYGDNGTHFFIYWTSDAYKSTGCYNLLCSGFIQTHNDIVIGGTSSPVSSYGGTQYAMTIFVWKDAVEGHWWLMYGNQFILGYWPNFLFPSMAETASLIQMGGEITDFQDTTEHTSTQMGSGHFAEEDFGKASFFGNIKVIDHSNLLRPPKHEQIKFLIDKPGCYNMKHGVHANGENYFFYGGPGRNPNCP